MDLKNVGKKLVVIECKDVVAGDEVVCGGAVNLVTEAWMEGEFLRMKWKGHPGWVGKSHATSPIYVLRSE